MSLLFVIVQSAAARSVYANTYYMVGGPTGKTNTTTMAFTMAEREKKDKQQIIIVVCQHFTINARIYAWIIACPIIQHSHRIVRMQ